jgi:hypothetical protein
MLNNLITSLKLALFGLFVECVATQQRFLRGDCTSFKRVA